MQKKLTYEEQLTHPCWYARRDEILERDDYCCQDCLRSPHKLSTHIKLQVHHKEYFDGLMAWEYADAYLITLCRECHAKLHGKIPDLRTEREKPVFIYGMRGFKSQPIKHVSEALVELVISIANGK